MFINLVNKSWPGALLLMALATPGSRAEEPKGSAKPALDQPEAVNKSRRRVYLLHSGVHTILSDAAKNSAAQTLKDGLGKRGVAEKDIVVLDNPFPTASWKSLFPFESLTMFFDFIEPTSRMSHEAYLRMHKALKAQDVSHRDDIVWIGHSAGGQIGLTMANLARNLWKFPNLAKETSPYHFDMIITLGTPVGADHLPPEVKLRHYYSPEDKVVRWVSKIGPWVGFPFGYRTRIYKVPAAVGDNCMIRCFDEIEHPSWDVEGRVLDRILGETSPDFHPLWHAPLPLAPWGLSLAELMCRALERHCHISIEDPPKNK